MTTQERLRLGGTELERELLSSALDDAPDPRSQQHLLAALGVGTFAVATAAQGATLGLGAKSATAGKLTLLVVAKWVGGGLLAGAITAGALEQASSPRRSVSAKSDYPPVAEAPLARPRVGKPLAVAAAEEIPAPPPVLPSQPKPSPPAEVAEPNVTDEVRSLDRARAELGRGQPVQAVAALDLYERQFPAGVLRPEADLVRLQAFARLGDKSTVAARARAFLAKYPSSPHAPQVRALLGQAEPSRPEGANAPAHSASVASFPVGE
jgi:hypothetical protein